MITDVQIEEAIALSLRSTESVPQELRSVAFGRVLKKVLDTVVSTSVKEAPTAAAGPGLALNSLPELVAAVKPKTNPQFLVAFAYYSLKSGEQRGITIKDIEDSFRQIRQRGPKNISDTLAACVGQGRGWLIESSQRKDGAKAWVITPGGESQLENGFQKI